MALTLCRRICLMVSRTHPPQTRFSINGTLVGVTLPFVPVVVAGLAYKPHNHIRVQAQTRHICP